MRHTASRFVRTALLLAALFVMLASCRRETRTTGLLFDREKYESVPQKAVLVTRAYENLPSSVSLVDYAPYPGNQGKFGTCVAWASVYGGMTTVDSSLQDRTDRSATTEAVYSPYYLFQMCNPGDTEGNGMYLEDALLFLREIGVPLRSRREEANIDRFDSFDAVSEYDGSDLFRIGDYASLFSYGAKNQQKILAVKKSLSEHKPVVIGFDCTRSFLYAREYWEPSRGDTDEGGHAMLVVGYDNDKRGGSFLIQNSWGSSWGKNGYVWVRYDDFAEYTHSAFEMSRAILSRPRPIDPVPAPHFDEPDPVTPPAPKRTVAYEGSFDIPVRYEQSGMRLSLKDGIYTTARAYDSYTKFQLYMTNTKPCYVYAFASDEATGKASVIFPLGNTSALLDYSENTVVYPAEDKYIQLDDVPGTDYFVVLYSSEPLDISRIAARYEDAVRSGLTGERNFFPRVAAAVGEERLMPSADVDFSDGAVRFTAYADEGTAPGVLPVLIQIRHE